MFVVPVARRPSAAYRLLDSSFERFVNSVAQSTPSTRSPALDVSESDGHFTAVLDLPGVAKADVKIAIDGRKVSIEAQAPVAEQKADAPAAEAPAAEAAAPAARAIHRERQAASYARSFVLPVELDQATSQARLEDGVLTLTLVKRAPTATRLTVA
ncbi:MAG TPA: Hsp20/alpha crystallin family protein [Ideonella sp.]|nr:Hsp20/alpha crystallin family protein [Ideonella sp.]